MSDRPNYSRGATPTLIWRTKWDGIPLQRERLKAEHAAVATVPPPNIEHAMAGGDILLVAKAQLGHDEWLPWLASCERKALRQSCRPRPANEPPDWIHDSRWRSGSPLT